MGWSGGGRSAQWPFAMREAASSQRRYEVQQARGGVTLTIELYRGPTHSGVCVVCRRWWLVRAVEIRYSQL